MQSIVKVGEIFFPNFKRDDDIVVCPANGFMPCKGTKCSKFMTTMEYCDHWCQKDECDDCLRSFYEDEECNGFCTL